MEEINHTTPNPIPNTPKGEANPTAKLDSTPHDTFAKAAFRNPLVYHPFITEHTPPSLLDQVNMEKIQVMPVGFPLSNPLQAADVVLRVSLPDASGWVYWIIEPQASRDDTMPLRLLLYKVEVLKYHLQSEEGRRDKKPPIILATVVYMGRRGWHPDSLDAFAPLDPSLREVARNAFAGESEFVDIKHTDLGTAPNAALQTVTLLMRRAYAHDKIKVLQEAEPLLEKIYAIPGGDALGDAAIRYVLNECGQKGQGNAKIILKGIHENLHGAVGEKAMSIAEILKHEGRKLGLEEGLHKGKLEKAFEIARAMLKEGLSLATIAKVTQLPPRDIKKLNNPKS